jgi:diguanylate cyclase
VARLGGDEFVLIMPGLRPDVFAQHADRFPRVVQRAGYNVCGENLMSMSLGLASFPADGLDADALLSEADRRMYEAKNRKKAMLTEEEKLGTVHSNTDFRPVKTGI